jgi:hypothetical protein
MDDLSMYYVWLNDNDGRATFFSNPGSGNNLSLAEPPNGGRNSAVSRT